MFKFSTAAPVLHTCLPQAQALQPAAPLSTEPQMQRLVGTSAATLPHSARLPIPPIFLSDDSIATAHTLGALNSLTTRSGFVGSSDTVDFYRFSTTGGAFNLALTGMTADADVRLIRDANGNDLVETSEIIASSRRGGSSDDTINLGAIAAGNYLIRVEQYSGDTHYTLRLSNTTPSNLLATETDIGTLNGTRVFSGSVNGDNTADTYRFSVTNLNLLGISLPRSVNITLTGLSGDADVRLIRDVNNNGAIDSNDVITGSYRSGATADWTNSSLATGSYLVQVYRYSTNSTNYHLSLSTGDWYSSNLTDAGIIGEARFAAADGTISRNDAIAILRETRDGDLVETAELTDLRRLLSAQGSLMPEYVRNLTHKVINGDAANARSGIGNLFAGSNHLQMERLIGKWFLGSDRPIADGTYRLASGSLFQGGISTDDIDQGSLGDCYFLSTLAALAQDRPAAISNLFIDNHDGTYTVRFFNGSAAEYVTVDRYLPVDSSNRFVYAGRDYEFNYDNPNNELWVALAEKAYAQLNQSGWIGQDNTNSYAGIDGGWMAPVMRQITGGTAMSQLATSMTQTQLINLVNANTPITAGFVRGGGFGVEDEHAYAITAYNATTRRFHLDNPWGDSDADVTWEELRSLVGQIEWSVN